MVSQNTLFTVIPFHHLSDVKERQNDQPGNNEELVPKGGTTSVVWSRVFKHCSFKTIYFKPLKLKQQSHMRALSNSV